MFDIYKFLEDNKIAYQRFDHQAVFTCEEAVNIPPMPGRMVKNLLLRDKNKSRYFLVVIGHEKTADLKALKNIFGVSKLGFASADDLKLYLGVEPGSVSILGLIYDVENKIEVYIDQDLWGQDLQVHPLINTASLVISNPDTIRFFELTKHPYRVISVN